MDVRKLKKVFERLRDSYSAAGASRPAKDVDAVANLLKGHEHKSVETFIDETKALLANDASPASDKAKLAERVVTRHVQRLLKASTDRQTFDQAMVALEEDPDVGRCELFAIANRYRNEPTGGSHEIKFRSLRQARATIRDVFLERVDAQSKRGAIDKLTRRAS